MSDLTLTTVPEMHAEMLIRRPPAEVYAAFAEPERTTRFWFSDSTGPLTAGAEVEWRWQAYGAAAQVRVTAAEPGRRLGFDWGDGTTSTSVTMAFAPHPDGTHVTVTETGFTGDGDAIAAHVADSAAGFTIALCSAKALLEQDVDLGAVGDAHPTAWTQ